VSSDRLTNVEQEILLAGEYLDQKGIVYSALSPRNPPEPDVRVTCNINGRTRRIGIELTDYHVDSRLKNDRPYSPRRSLLGSWETIVSVVQNEFVEKHPILTEFEVHATLDEVHIPSKNKCKDVARDLVNFLLPRLTSIEHRFQQDHFVRGSLLDPNGEFANNPYVRRHFESLRVWRKYDRPKQRIFWSCFDGSAIGLRRDIIEDIIRRKSCKATDYDTDELDEMWLLIAASGATSVNRGTPMLTDEARKSLTCEDIVEAAKSSPFDRIFFWERVGDWHFDIIR